MGKLITVWSPLHGQCKTTATLIAMALQKGNEGHRVIITHIQPRFSAMEDYLGHGDHDHTGLLNDTGLNNLVYNSMARPLAEKDIKAAAININEYVSFIPALGQGQLDEEKDMLISRLIVKDLPQYYEYVFVDLGTETGESAFGKARPLIKEITKHANTNFVVLPQNRWLWKEHSEIPNAKYIITGYDEDSAFSTFRFRFSVGKPASAVPICAEYADALGNGKASEFFERNKAILSAPLANDKKDNIKKFIKSVSEVLK